MERLRARVAGLEAELADLRTHLVGGEPTSEADAATIDGRERLRRRAATITTALRSTGLLIWSWDRASGLVELVVGPPRLSDVAGDHGRSGPLAWLRRVARDDRPALIDGFRQLLRGVRPTLDQQCRLDTADGTRWVQVRAVATALRDGRIERIAGLIEDVTEMNRLERVLNEAIESLPEGFALFDEQDRLILMNSRYREFYRQHEASLRIGVTFEEMLREGVASGRFVGAVGREEAWIAERMERHRAAVGSVEQRLPTGRWVRATERRTPSGFLAGLRIDITREKQAIVDAEASARRFRVIAETINHPVIIGRRSDARILFANEAAARIHGITAAEMIGRSGAANWADPEERRAYLEALDRDGRVEAFEARFVNRQRGKILWSLLSATRIEYDGEDAVLVSHVDITDLHEAQARLQASRDELERLVEQRTRQLRDSEARFRDFAGIAADWFWEMDAELRYSYLSDRWQTITGEQPSRVLGRTAAEAGGDGAAPAALAERREFRDFVHRRERPDGATIWLSISGRPQFDADGRFLGYRGTGRDVTKEKSAEEGYARARMEAEVASRAKSEFLSSMSHELRTPLNAILGFGQLLRFDPTTPLSEKQDAAVGHILKGGDHLLALIDQVLDLAKVESGRIPVSAEPVDLSDLLGESATMVTPSAERRRISVTTRPVPEDAATVLADPIRLKQVVLNLLSNAVKYNRQGGSVVLAAARLPDGRIRITVADTGRGIPAELQPHVFEPFSRFAEATTPVEGTGIGLTISRKLIEMMGGEIGLASEEGIGSTFWVDLPPAAGRRPIPLPPHDPVAAEDDGARPFTVLYIEDDPANLELMETVLSRVAHTRMISAHTSELGLDRAEAERPDLILMDINLPGMNGIEALAELRAREATRAIPVVAVSGALLPGEGAGGDGFYACLSKPFRVDALIGLLAEIRAGSRA